MTLRPETILQHAESSAAELRTAFEDRPIEELRAWLRLAHQREAMVTKLYDVDHLQKRLRRCQRRGPADVVSATVSSIWCHEESHTRYLGSLRSLADESPELAELQGKLEGALTRSAISESGELARALIVAGSLFQPVPEFVRELSAMNLREFLEFYSVLEATARAGYARIVELVKQIGRQAEELATLGPAFYFDMLRISSEEQFHEHAFAAMTTWCAADGDDFLELPADRCLGALHDLCERDLSMAAVQRRAGTGVLIAKGGESAAWVSDGGLGAVFRAHRLPVLVADPALARTQLDL